MTRQHLISCQYSVTLGKLWRHLFQLMHLFTVTLANNVRSLSRRWWNVLDVFPPFTASLRRPLNADKPSSTTTSWSFSSVAKVIPHGWFNALFEGITGLLPYLPTRSHLPFAPGRDRNECNTRGNTRVLCNFVFCSVWVALNYGSEILFSDYGIKETLRYINRGAINCHIE